MFKLFLKGRLKFSLMHATRSPLYNKEVVPLTYSYQLLKYFVCNRSGLTELWLSVSPCLRSEVFKALRPCKAPPNDIFDSVLGQSAHGPHVHPGHHVHPQDANTLLIPENFEQVGSIHHCFIYNFP